MATPSPRSARSSSGFIARTSRPSNLISPATIRLGSSRRRIRESAVTLLPDPDSPTMPSVSPAATEKLTPSTARTTPASVKKYVLRSRTSSTVRPACGARSASGAGSSAFIATPSSPARLGIEPVADAVAEKVETEHDGQNRKSREGRDPPLLHELATLRHHRAPFGRRRHDAEAEKRERRERDDGVADVEGE